MKNLSRKQFNRLTYVQKVEMALAAFNVRIQKLLDTYEFYRKEAESEEKARVCSEILSERLKEEFKRIHELLSELQEVAMYHLCQHYGATEPDFRAKIDRKFPSDEPDYWTGKKLNPFKLNDIREALDMIAEAFEEMEDNPLHVLIQKKDEVNQ